MGVLNYDESADKNIIYTYTYSFWQVIHFYDAVNSNFITSDAKEKAMRHRIKKSNKDVDEPKNNSRLT